MSALLRPHSLSRSCTTFVQRRSARLSHGSVDPALWFEPALELDHPSTLQELLDNKCGTLQVLERAGLGEVRDRA